MKKKKTCNVFSYLQATTPIINYYANEKTFTKKRCLGWPEPCLSSPAQASGPVLAPKACETLGQLSNPARGARRGNFGVFGSKTLGKPEENEGIRRAKRAGKNGVPAPSPAGEISVFRVEFHFPHDVHPI